MHFATIASGSSGNAILVGSGSRHLLIDCGISARKLLHNLALIGLNPEEIEGIVVTHEHIDHVRGVGVVARKLKIPVMATPKLWSAMGSGIGALAETQRQEISPDQPISIGGLEVRLFPTSHDSIESYGLKIICPRTGTGEPLTLGVATDTGVVTQEMDRQLRNCDALIVEANHDKEMLWQGRYPWPLKKRVSGERGHLENRQLGEALCDWVQERTQKVVLAHLSEENNTPEIALKTVMGMLKDANIHKKNPDLRLRVAPRYLPHELVKIS